MASVTLFDSNGDEYPLEKLQQDDSITPTEETEIIKEIKFTYLCPYCETEQQTEYTNFIPGDHVTDCTHCEKPIPITESAMDEKRVFIYPSESDSIVQQLETLYVLGQTAKTEDGEIYTYLNTVRPLSLSILCVGLIFSFGTALLLAFMGLFDSPYVYVSYGMAVASILPSFFGSLYEHFRIKKMLRSEVKLNELIQFKPVYSTIFEEREEP
jgi:hypothetical protein